MVKYALFKNGIFQKTILGTTDWTEETVGKANQSFKRLAESYDTYKGCEIKEVREDV